MPLAPTEATIHKAPDKAIFQPKSTNLSYFSTKIYVVGTH